MRMAEVLVLSEAEVAGLLDVDELLEALADAFRDLSAGRASVPPRIAARAEQGILGAMPVHLPGVALGAKLVSVFPGNHERGLPSHQALIVVFDEHDGTPVAHVSWVGGTFGRELDAGTARAGGVFVEGRGAAREPPPAGAHDLQGLGADAVTEIGEVLAGTRPGRTARDEITVYRSTGHAVEDAAAARLVYERAR